MLARTDLVELIDSRVPLKKTGHNHSACCPFHQEKTPSFSVNGNKQFFHCFGCGVSGNAISFLMEYDRLDFLDAVDELASRLGIEVPREASNTPSISPSLYELMLKASDFYFGHLSRNSKAKNYVAERGLSQEVVEQFKLGYATEAWDGLLSNLSQNSETTKQLIEVGMVIKNDNGKTYDRFRDRLMFPIRDKRGKVIAFGGRIIGDGKPKYLNSPETPIFHKGKELYGLYEAKQQNRQLSRLIIVEGYMDVVALAQFGVTNAVATLGTATTDFHLQQLFKTVNEIIFCFDGDKAGQAAAWKALEIALPLIRGDRIVRFMFLPEGEDPDTLIRAQGKEGFEQQQEISLPLSEYLLNELSKDMNLDIADEKSRFLGRLKPYLEKITDLIFKEMLIDAAGKRLGMNPNQLAVSLGMTTKRESFKPRQTTSSAKTITPMRMLVALLVQNPELAKEITNTDWLLTVQQNGSILLKSLLDLLHSSPHLTTGALLEHWRGNDEHGLLLKLATWEHLIEESETRVEVFRDSIAKIFKELAQTRRDELIAKHKSQSLNSEETDELRRLLSSNS